jgi:ABC-type Mn2+/Zn2+ transport system ATPase subunit
MTALLELRGVTAGYSAEPVLSRLNLTLDEGSYYGIVGPSGAGKTTLLRVILGTLRPSAGQVLLAGRPVRPGSSPVGYVPQVETVDWNFPVSVQEVVAMGLAGERQRSPRISGSVRKEISVLLERLGLGGYEHRHIRTLSGGQQQRTFLARALIRRPQLLVLDEPTSGVDVATRRGMLDLLDELNADGTAIVVTTHDLNAVAARLPSLVCLNGGIVAVGPPERIFRPEVLRRTFGANMAVVTHHGQLLAVEVPEVGIAHEHHVHVHHGAPDVASAEAAVT